MRLLPQPGTPVISTPFGSGRPQAFAGVQPRAVALLQPALEVLQPADVVEGPVRSEYSRIPLLRIIWRFSSRIDVHVVARGSPSFTMALAKAFSASARVKPDGGLREPFEVVVGRDDLDPPALAVHLDHAVEQRPDLVLVGQREVDDRDDLLEVGRKVLTGETMIKHAGLVFVRNLDAMSRNRRTTLGSAGRPPPPRAW